MKKLIAIMCMLYLSISSMTGAVYATSVQDWGGLKLDSSAPTEKISADIINTYLEERGQSALAKDDRIGNAIMDSSLKNGINPVILLGMFTIETGWGSNPKFLELLNPGGIKCKTGYDCAPSPDCTKGSGCVKWTKFETLEQGFQVKGELLRGYMKNRGAVTFKDGIEIYAPPSDGNDLYSEGGYIAHIGSTADKLGITLEEMGGSITPDANGTGTYADGTKVGTWESFFMSDELFSSSTGVDKGQSILPTEVSYAFANFSDKTAERLAVAGVVLSLGIIVYINLIVFSYTLIIKGHASPNSLFGKLVRLDGDVYSKKTIVTIVTKAALGILIICLYLTGMYLKIMGALYGLYENIIFYLFG